MLSKRLVFLRKKRNKTQEEISKIIGVTRPAYTAYEKGTRTPDYEVLKTLSNYYSVTTDYILGNSDYPNPEFDSLKELKKITTELGIKDLAFYDLDQWKNLNKEDIEDINKHFEFVVHKEKERNKGN